MFLALFACSKQGISWPGTCRRPDAFVPLLQHNDICIQNLLRSLSKTKPTPFATSTLSQCKGRVPQPSITWGGQPARGWGWVLHDNDVRDSIRPIRLTVALGLKRKNPIEKDEDSSGTARFKLCTTGHPKLQTCGQNKGRICWVNVDKRGIFEPHTHEGLRLK